MTGKHRFTTDEVDKFSTVELISELKRRYQVLSRPNRNCVLLGPSLSGVSTQADVLRREWGLCSLKRVEFLPNSNASLTEAVAKMSIEIDSFRCRKGFVLENFPVNEEEATLFDDMLAKKHKERMEYRTILLNMPHNNDIESEASLDQLMSRASGHLIHKPSGRIYNSNVSELAPQTSKTDDVTGEALVGPSYDISSLKANVASWWSTRQPILERYFGSRLERVDASQPMDSVSSAINQVLLIPRKAMQDDIGNASS